MADPLQCLRGATITIAIWNIVYSLIQLGIFGWQTRFLNDLRWSFFGRPIPPFDPYLNYFPGVNSVYMESPQQRRVNALFALAVGSLIFSFVHLCLTSVLLIGSGLKPNAVWPWFFSAIPLIALSTAYAVLWWSGDIFGEQLTMSVAEFVMSLAINSICVIVVAFYYFRLRGRLTSTRAKSVRIYGDESDSSARVGEWREKQHDQPPRVPERGIRIYDDVARELNPAIPEWRQERPEQPPPAIEREIRAMETGFRRATSGRLADPRRSRRDERRNVERPVRGPYASRDIIPRASMQRRAASEPRASQRRPQHIAGNRSRSPLRAGAQNRSSLTPGRLRAHNNTMERMRRSRQNIVTLRNPNA